MNNNAINLSKNSDVLICESTFSLEHEKRAKKYKHLVSTQAATIAKKSRSKKLLLTHISRRYQKDTKKLLNEAKKVFKNTEIANDFDKITL